MKKLSVLMSRLGKCGRCERACPNNAVKITLHNKNAVADVIKRIQQYASVN
ncbi:MAG: 4Fe-4S binding protein [Deltaproteobacteria bacterium]|nr:4Fe-4S binding protein [Deltaproteobacteria bacterium]